jgi:hypothetical protein
VREHPLLFSGPLVRAILDGRKTMTRRPMKPQPLLYTGRKYVFPDDGPKWTQQDGSVLAHCPFGVVGDRLWVRESFRRAERVHWPDLSHCVNPNDPHDVIFHAEGFDRSTGSTRLWPSIHMPRWASRLTLEITDVRVERLQAITDDDAAAEGILGVMCNRIGPNFGKPMGQRASFARLWDEVYGAGAWALDPWVWALTFQVLP